MKYDIFISYSRKDIEFARKVCAVLDSYKQYYDFEYFFDQSEITCRDEYLKRISSAILESRVVLFLASKNSYDSEFCAKELLFADKKGRHIHQYLLDEAEMPSDIEMLLGTHQYRELKNTPIESVVKEVLSNSLSCEILTLDELNENNKLERQKQRSIQQQEIREKISALENRCFEIKAEILSYEQKVAELEREKSSVERQIEDLRCKLTGDEKRDDEQQSTKLHDFIERLKILMKRPAVWLSAVAILVIALLAGLVLSFDSKETYEVVVEESKVDNEELVRESDKLSADPVVEEIKYSVGYVYDDGTKKGDIEESRVDNKELLYESDKLPADFVVKETKYSVGDFYDDGTKQGVVFEVSEDGKHGKIVSLKETTCKWSTDILYPEISVGEGCINPGKAKTDIVMRSKDCDEYPAFKWCREQGEEWYLPSKEELMAIYDVKDLVNKTLVQYSYREITNAWHWSSTERSKLYAWGVYMGSGNTGLDHKSFYSSVRAVSAF